MKRKHLMAMGLTAAVAAGLAGVAAATAIQSPAPAQAQTQMDGTRYTPASELTATQLLNAKVISAQGRATGRIERIRMDAGGQADWVWLHFNDGFGGWTLRAPVSGLYADRVSGTLRADRTAEELRRLAEADPEAAASTATAIPAYAAPASRLMGLTIVEEDDDRLGFVHSVNVDENGAVDTLVVERRFGLFSAKMERYELPAEQVTYLPVTQRLMVRETPQPALASLSHLG